MARARAVDTSRLSPMLVVLRKVDANALSRRTTNTEISTYDLIGNGQIEQGVVESDTQWYADGLLLNDQPHDSKVSDDIARATLGFAVANTRNGEIVGEFSTLSEAERVCAGAHISVEDED